MIVQARGIKRSARATLLIAAVLAVAPGMLCAQEEETKAAPVGLTLEDCIALGMQRQPAIAAAQASLNSAYIGQRSLNNLKFAALFSRDIPVRKQQACLGITISSAQLKQIEWDTRYAVTRNYYSVIYARMQLDVVQGLVKRLTEARDQAKHLVEKGAGAVKVTALDVDALDVNLELVKVKQAEAETGILRAIAALREAIGIGPDYPIEVAGGELPDLLPGLDKQMLIHSALANRGEVTMASAASSVTNLEIEAQSRLLFKVKTPTFASGSDIHAQPIPTGTNNGEYRPGAIGLEMPVSLVGKRHDRMDRASALFDRSLAVVDKTQNLVALEVEATYLKWLEASQKVGNLERALKKATPLARDVQKRFTEGNVSGQEYLQARTLVDQTQALLNEALYNHALALANLERATAGGFIIPRPAVTAPAEEK